MKHNERQSRIYLHCLWSFKSCVVSLYAVCALAHVQSLGAFLACCCPPDASQRTGCWQCRLSVWRTPRKRLRPRAQAGRGGAPRMTGLLRSRSQGRQAPARSVAQRAELIALACVAAVLLWGLFLVPLSPEPAAPAGDHGGRTLLRRSLLGARYTTGACHLSWTCRCKALVGQGCLRAAIASAAVCAPASPGLMAWSSGGVRKRHASVPNLEASPSERTAYLTPSVARRAGQPVQLSHSSHTRPRGSGGALQGCGELAARPLTEPLTPRRATAGPAPAGCGRRCAAGQRGAAPALAQDAAAGRAPLARARLPARQLAGAAAGQARAPSLPGSPPDGLLRGVPPGMSAEAWAHHGGLPMCVLAVQTWNANTESLWSGVAWFTGRPSAPRLAPKATCTYSYYQQQGQAVACCRARHAVTHHLHTQLRAALSAARVAHRTCRGASRHTALWLCRRAPAGGSSGAGSGAGIADDADMRDKLAAVLLRRGGDGTGQGPPARAASTVAGIAAAAAAAGGGAARPDPGTGAPTRASPAEPGAAGAGLGGAARASARVRVSVRRDAEPIAWRGEGAAAAHGRGEVPEPPPDRGDRPPEDPPLTTAGGGGGGGQRASGAGAWAAAEPILIGTASGDVDFGAEAARGITGSETQGAGRAQTRQALGAARLLCTAASQCCLRAPCQAHMLGRQGVMQ